MPYKDKEKALANSRKSYAKRSKDKIFKESKREKRNATARHWYNKHKARLYADPEWVDTKRKAKRDWAAAHPESGKAWKLKKFYGLSLQDFQDKLVEQDNCCAI